MRTPGSAVALALMMACGTTSQTECTSAPVEGNSCVPVAAAAGQPLVLRIRPTGCGNVCSGTVAYSCEVLLRGQTLTLAVEARTCITEERPVVPRPYVQTTDCATICMLPQPVDCQVPALAVGDYTVAVPGAADKTLHVMATGQTECTAPDPL